MLEHIESIADYYKLSISSFFAGLCISIGCIVNLSIGGIAGAILFTFGLITVVHYKYALYTGTAGFVESRSDILKLFFVIFLNNFLGCLFAALLVRYSIPNLIESVSPIIEQRNSVDFIQSGIRGIFCGFLMTTAVEFARQNRWLPLLFAVPVFILAGFYHSIADAFYICLTDDLEYKTIINYIFIIIGNFVGCNLNRLNK